MAQIEALVTPMVLQWARERSGFTVAEAAKKLKRPQEEVESWESGNKRPSISQARKASELYKRPLAVFYLPEPPTDFETLRDFRKLPNDVDRSFDKELVEVIRVAYEHQSWVKEFLQEEGIPPLPFVGSASLSDNPKAIASEILRTFDIAPEDQIRSQSRYYALKLWVSRVESKGIYIFKSGGIDLQACRGFILSDILAPFIFLNSEDAHAAQLFTLVHELAHLWLAVSSLSNLGPNGSYVHSEAQQIETYCNQVASEALIDSSRFDSELQKLNQSLVINQKIERLSQVFKVSEEAVARRLLQIGYISNQRYLKLREYYQDRWVELKKLEDERAKEKSGGPSYYVTKVSHNGLLFTQTVLGAYLGGRIGGRDASSLLGVKVNNLPKLASQVGMPGLL